MKRLLALGVLTAAAVALPASPAIADAPPGQGLERFTVECAEGTIQVVGSPGDSASRWINDQHMVLLSITFTANEGVSIKAFGQKKGLATNAVSCTVTFPDGTTAKVIRTPVPPQG
jgi:hypothetical protein